MTPRAHRNVMMATTKPYTADDLIAMGKDAPFELIMGELVEVSLAPMKASAVAAHMASELASFVWPRKLGLVVGANCGFWLTHHPDTVVAPDAAFVQSSRVPHDIRSVGYLPGAPDLAVEITSSLQRPGEVERRVDLYLAAGSTLVWIVESQEEVVHVVRPNGARRTIPSNDAIDGEEVLPGFLLPVADLFDLFG